MDFKNRIHKYIIVTPVEGGWVRTKQIIRERDPLGAVLLAQPMFEGPIAAVRFSKFKGLYGLY